MVQSPYGQILDDLQNEMRGVSSFLCPTVTEGWLRRYQVYRLHLSRLLTLKLIVQVLPGRTHPTMMTSGTGGFLLHAIKV